MTMTESEIIVTVSCIIDFDNTQVWLRLFSLNLNACKVMMVFFKIWPDNIKKALITLQALRLKLKVLMKLVYRRYRWCSLLKRFFPILLSWLRKDCRNSAVGKKWVFVGKKMHHASTGRVSPGEIVVKTMGTAVQSCSYRRAIFVGDGARVAWERFRFPH